MATCGAKAAAGLFACSENQTRLVAIQQVLLFANVLGLRLWTEEDLVCDFEWHVRHSQLRLFGAFDVNFFLRSRFAVEQPFQIDHSCTHGRYLPHEVVAAK